MDGSDVNDGLRWQFEGSEGCGKVFAPVGGRVVRGECQLECCTMPVVVVLPFKQVVACVQRQQRQFGGGYRTASAIWERTSFGNDVFVEQDARPRPAEVGMDAVTPRLRDVQGADPVGAEMFSLYVKKG